MSMKGGTGSDRAKFSWLWGVREGRKKREKVRDIHVSKVSMTHYIFWDCIWPSLIITKETLSAYSKENTAPWLKKR